MNKILCGTVIVLSCGIIAFVNMRRMIVPNPEFDRPGISYSAPEEPKSNPVVMSATMPILIVENKDTQIIVDEKLRKFVVRNAVFDRDKVLYFEWSGGPSDKMEGITVSDLETKNKRYMIKLKVTTGERMLHSQVFIIPKSYTYEMEISNESNIRND